MACELNALRASRSIVGKIQAGCCAAIDSGLVDHANCTVRGRSKSGGSHRTIAGLREVRAVAAADGNTGDGQFAGAAVG